MYKESEHINKIVVVGAGNVGQAIAYTLLIRQQANDIVIIDVSPKRAESAARDIAEATGFYTHINVRAGEYEECKDADMVIITAGVGRKVGQSRLDLAKTNVGIIRDVMSSVMRYNDDPMTLVVTNPVDIVTAAALKEAGTDSRRIMGSGTTLDTARLRFIISDLMKIGVADAHAYVIGEHGDSHVPVWSEVHIAGVRLSDYERQTGVTLDKQWVEEYIKKSGAEIIAGKGATFYGIAMSVSGVVENLLNDKHGVMPLTHRLGKEFGDWAGTVISMPCMIGRTGIERTLDIPMNEEERSKMNASVGLIRQLQSELGLL